MNVKYFNRFWTLQTIEKVFWKFAKRKYFQNWVMGGNMLTRMFCICLWNKINQKLIIDGFTGWKNCKTYINLRDYWENHFLTNWILFFLHICKWMISTRGIQRVKNIYVYHSQITRRIFIDRGLIP